MLIMIFAFLSCLSLSSGDNTKEIKLLKKSDVKVATTLEETKPVIEKKYPFEVSLFTNYTKNYPNADFNMLVYGLSFGYQISDYFKLSLLVGDTHISDIPALDGTSNSYEDDGFKYGLNGEFNYIYKNLYSAVDIDLLHTNMNKIKDFNIFIITPHIGYINDSRTLIRWVGFTYSYEDQEFDINVKDSILVPTIGVKRVFKSQIELSAELQFNHDYREINFNGTYKF